MDIKNRQKYCHSTGEKLSSSAECRIRTQGLWSAHTYMNLYSGICTSTGNIHIWKFHMIMLQWFQEQTLRWLSFETQQLSLLTDVFVRSEGTERLIIEDGLAEIAIVTSRVVGRRLSHYTDFASYSLGVIKIVSSVNTKSRNLGCLE